MLIVNGELRDQLDISYRSTSSRCNTYKAKWSLKMLMSCVPVWPSAILQLFVWGLCASRNHILTYKARVFDVPGTRSTKTMWQSLCLQPCVVRLQSPLSTPLAAVPGDPTLDWTHIPTFKTQAHIPCWWSGSGEERFPCQNQRQCGGWASWYIPFFCESNE